MRERERERKREREGGGGRHLGVADAVTRPAVIIMH